MEAPPQVPRCSRPRIPGPWCRSKGRSFHARRGKSNSSTPNAGISVLEKQALGPLASSRTAIQVFFSPLMWRAVSTLKFCPKETILFGGVSGGVQASGCSQEWGTWWLAARRLVAPKGQWAKLYQRVPGKVPGRKSPPGILTQRLASHIASAALQKGPKFNWIQLQSNSCPRPSSKTKQSANNWSWFLSMPPRKADHWTDREIVKERSVKICHPTWLPKAAPSKEWNQRRH